PRSGAEQSRATGRGAGGAKGGGQGECEPACRFGLSYNVSSLRDSLETSMYIVTSRRRETGQVESRHVDSHPRVLDVGLALLDRGDELISISVTNGAFPVTPEDIQTARAARARYAAQGVRYNEQLAALLSEGVLKASLSVSSIIIPETITTAGMIVRATSLVW